MEDVIFAGTGDRPPLGRAEVTLTIDNCDGALPIEYGEVAITRRMFRDGASEYEINGSRCRLLDIQELLSDSGIGREMHVIVGQGQLDAVLSARPEDRRAFIEEAAGVLKHRKRKEKALRKLDAMQANLTRLTDLTGELRRQLKPLGRQAEVARRAAGIQAELRDARMRLLADDLARAAEVAGRRGRRRRPLGSTANGCRPSWPTATAAQDAAPLRCADARAGAAAGRADLVRAVCARRTVPRHPAPGPGAGAPPGHRRHAMPARAAIRTNSRPPRPPLTRPSRPNAARGRGRTAALAAAVGRREACETELRRAEQAVVAANGRSPTGGRAWPGSPGRSARPVRGWPPLPTRSAGWTCRWQPPSAAATDAGPSSPAQASVGELDDVEVGLDEAHEAARRRPTAAAAALAELSDGCAPPSRAPTLRPGWTRCALGLGRADGSRPCWRGEGCPGVLGASPSTGHRPGLRDSGRRGARCARRCRGGRRRGRRGHGPGTVARARKRPRRRGRRARAGPTGAVGPSCRPARAGRSTCSPPESAAPALARALRPGSRSSPTWPPRATLSSRSGRPRGHRGRRSDRPDWADGGSAGGQSMLEIQATRDGAADDSPTAPADRRARGALWPAPGRNSAASR